MKLIITNCEVKSDNFVFTIEGADGIDLKDYLISKGLRGDEFLLSYTDKEAYIWINIDLYKLRFPVELRYFEAEKGFYAVLDGFEDYLRLHAPEPCSKSLNLSEYLDGLDKDKAKSLSKVIKTAIAEALEGAYTEIPTFGPQINEYSKDRNKLTYHFHPDVDDVLLRRLKYIAEQKRQEFLEPKKKENKEAPREEPKSPPTVKNPQYQSPIYTVKPIIEKDFFMITFVVPSFAQKEIHSRCKDYVVKNKLCEISGVKFLPNSIKIPKLKIKEKNFDKLTRFIQESLAKNQPKEPMRF